MSDLPRLLDRAQAGDPNAAEALNISARTADRLWAYARSWLRQELKQDESA